MQSKSLNNLLALLAFLFMALPVSGQITVPGKTTYDKFLSAFWSQNSNASNLVAGVNANAEIPFDNDSITNTFTNKTFQGTFSLTNTPTFRTYDSGSAVWQTWNWQTTNGVPMLSNTVSRVGMTETLSNKTIWSPTITNTSEQWNFNVVASQTSNTVARILNLLTTNNTQAGWLTALGFTEAESQPLTGYGTANYIPCYNATNTITNTSMYYGPSSNAFTSTADFYIGGRIFDTNNIKYYGAKGDGSTDDTAVFQSVLNTKTNVYIPDGVFIIRDVLVTNSLKRLYGNGTLRYPNSNSTYYGILWIDNISDVSIDGITFDGNYSGQTNWTAFNHCLRIRSATNIFVHGALFTNIIGDGIYISHSDITTNNASHNTLIDTCYFSSGNYNRNGISVCDAHGVGIYNCTFVNISTNTMPGAIDLEPDYSHDEVVNISIDNNKFSGCRVAIAAANAAGCGLTNWNNIRISNNTISGSIYGGIVMSPINDTIICGNKLYLGNVYGIWVGGVGVKVTDNFITGSSYGINTSGSTNLCISDNSILYPVSSGVYLYASPNSRITGNYIANTGTGIYNYGNSTNTVISENTLINATNTFLADNGSSGLIFFMNNYSGGTTLYNLSGANYIGSTQIYTNYTHDSGGTAMVTNVVEHYSGMFVTNTITQ